MKKEDLVVHCPKCKQPVQLDMSGCVTCYSCREEYTKKYGYFAGTEMFIDKVLMKIPQYEIIILKKGAWNKILTSGETAK